jgi:hypothetical protein
MDSIIAFFTVVYHRGLKINKKKLGLRSTIFISEGDNMLELFTG